MRNTLRQLLCGLCLAALVSCGPSAVDDTPRCLSVKEPPGGAGLLTEAPARVSLFFSVDTCGGEPVPGLGADDFLITEDGKPVSAFESQRSVSARAQRYRMFSVLLLDLSGSVLRSGQFPQLKEAAVTYARTVLAAAGGGQRLAVLSFDGQEAPQTLVGFTDDAEAVARALDALEQPECTTNAECSGFADRRTCAGWRCVDDSTNLNGGLVSALDTLEAKLAEATDVTWRDASLVVFTDGTDQAARVAQTDALARARTSRAHVFTVGLGGEADEGALRAFGKDGYWPAADASSLAGAFEAIARQVVGVANRFYLLEYCSPKRSGVHTLKVTVSLPQPEGPPLVGGLSREFDASTFLSGCELTAP